MNKKRIVRKIARSPVVQTIIDGFLIGLLVFILLAVNLAIADSKTDNRPVPRPVIGYLEKVQVQESSGNISLKAKIDTGADQSSIHAINPVFYKKHGEKWVSFVVVDEGGREFEVDRKVLRHVFIKRKSLDSEKRVVVNLGLCVEKVYKEVEVNLSNRSNFKHSLLVGRSFLKDHFLIDSSKKYLVNPGCKKSSSAG